MSVGRTSKHKSWQILSSVTS